MQEIEVLVFPGIPFINMVLVYALSGNWFKQNGVKMAL
jgi:hypothetical protein